LVKGDGEMQSQVPLDDNDKRRLILRLIAQMRCVKCGQAYDPADLTLVHRCQDRWVLSTRCRNCGDPCHVIVFMRLDAEPETVVDLTPEERQIADKWPPITADDVLDVHALLQESDGDLETLLAG
jgi:hypothetical protein